MRLMRLAKQLTLSWVANAVVLAVVTAVLSGVTVDTVGDLIRAALLFGILNTIVKPLLRLLTFEEVPRKDKRLCICQEMIS